MIRLKVALRVSRQNCTSDPAIMLTASLHQTTAERVDLTGLTDPGCKEIVGMPHSAALIGLCGAFMAGDASALASAWDLPVHEMGPEAMEAAAGIASNFQRMNRIADGTGMPLEPIGHQKTVASREALNEQLGIIRYRSAINTKSFA